MTPLEQSAFAAGIEAARQAALIAAVTIETRDAANEVRQQAAAALVGLAEGLRAAFLDSQAEPKMASRSVTPSAPEAPDAQGGRKSLSPRWLMKVGP